MAVREGDMGGDEMGVGRYVMVCCENDMQFMGLICSRAPEGQFRDGDWMELTSVLRLEYNAHYSGTGPVLTPISAVPADAPFPEFASFY